MTKGLKITTSAQSARKDEELRRIVNPAPYTTRGALPPSKADRDRVRAVLVSRARLV